MADQPGKVVVNLATGHEDADRVTVALLVVAAAAEHCSCARSASRREASTRGNSSRMLDWRVQPRCGSGSAMAMPPSSATDAHRRAF
ncbi:MAG: hypothetical protein WBM00_07045 [Solirubrobacterales bacterium]